MGGAFWPIMYGKVNDGEGVLGSYIELRIISNRCLQPERHETKHCSSIIVKYSAELAIMGRETILFVF
jgi:hypothetical protein